MENEASTLNFVQKAFSASKEDYFDGMVVWVTRSNLMALYAHSPCATLSNQPRFVFG